MRCQLNVTRIQRPHHQGLAPLMDVTAQALYQVEKGYSPKPKEAAYCWLSRELAASWL